MELFRLLEWTGRTPSCLIMGIFEFYDDDILLILHLYVNDYDCELSLSYHLLMFTILKQPYDRMFHVSLHDKMLM